MWKIYRESDITQWREDMNIIFEWCHTYFRVVSNNWLTETLIWLFRHYTGQ